jgi:G:T-mismatch repair DNA endonuclease (very short patch repair protein)
MTKQLSSAQELAIPKWVSAPEKDLREFISDLGLDFTGSNRSLLKGVEVDIVIPSLKIGIEFNGNRYHSEVYGKKDRMHHLNKLIKMNDVGYGLIQIFEDEWEERAQQVRSKLKRMLGRDNSLKISARDCDISLIDASIKNAFLNKFHIQGEDRSTIHYGLIHKDDLVAVMTFDPYRNMTKSKEGQYELKRFSTKEGFFVRGGASKLLTSFIRDVKPKSVMSFADRRWTLNFDNNMYTKLGFSFDGSTPPEYHYYNNKLHRIRRWSKFGFGRKSIASKFPHIYHTEKTEWQMMQEAGFDRIWDCGKFRYVMNF